MAKAPSQCPICAGACRCTRATALSSPKPVLATLSIATDTSPQNNVLAQPSTFDPYQSTPGALAMAPSVSTVGGSQPHTNFKPYLCVNFIISLFGIFPSPT